MTKIYVAPLVPRELTLDLEAIHLFQVYTIWTVLMICESNPEVISMPIHAGNKMK